MNLDALKNGGLPGTSLMDANSIADSFYEKVPKEGNTITKTVTTSETPDDEFDEDKDKTEETVIEDKDKPKVEEDDKDKPTDDENKEPITNEPEEDSVIAAFSADFGEVEGEFEENLDGVKTYFSKVLEKTKVSSILEGQKLLLESQPELKALKEHLDAGYGMNSFLRKQEMTDWDSIKLESSGDEEKDKETLVLAERIYRHARTIKGDDKDEIEDAIETAKDKGTLLERATKAKDYLKKQEEGEIEKQKLVEKQQYDNLLKEKKAFLDEAETILKSGDINGIKLPANEIQKLREFSLVEDKEGKTPRDRRIESLTVKEGLLLDRILMNNFKDVGAKVVTSTPEKTQNAFSKLKAKNDEKVKPNLSSDGVTKPNIRTMFGQNNN